MNNGNELKQELVAEEAGLPTPAEIRFDARAVEAKMTQITRAIDACTKISIQRTNPADWVKMGKGYYMTAPAAMKIRTIWGIYFRNLQIAREVKDDGSVAFTVTGEVGSKLLDNWYGSEVIIECLGSRASSDPFFGKDPDLEDVKKAALANFRARAVCQILGLDNMTEEDLRKNGIDPAKVTSVEFKTGSKGGSIETEDDKALQVKLFNVLVKLMGTSDEGALSKALEELSGFEGKDGKKVPGVKSLKDLRGKRLQVTYAKAKERLEKEGGVINVD